MSFRKFGCQQNNLAAARLAEQGIPVFGGVALIAMKYHQNGRARWTGFGNEIMNRDRTLIEGIQRRENEAARA